MMPWAMVREETPDESEKLQRSAPFVLMSYVWAGLEDSGFSGKLLGIQVVIFAQWLAI